MERFIDKGLTEEQKERMWKELLDKIREYEKEKQCKRLLKAIFED